MHGTMAGMEDFDPDEDIEDNVDIWKHLKEQDQTTGGLNSAISKPADRLEDSENAVLLELFNNIMNCTSVDEKTGNGSKKMPDPANPNKLIDADYFDEADLMKWCSNRFNTVRDQKQKEALEEIVNIETIDEACTGCMKHDTDNEGRLTFDVFRRGMCDYTSTMRKVVLAMLNTFPDMERWQYLEAVSGELSKTDYIVMYHKHLTDVVKACRKQLKEEGEHSSFIDNREKVCKAYLSGIEKEVEGLLKKFDEYHQRLRSLQPSLRESNQGGIDDVFDGNFLPGERWDSVNPRRSWA